MPFPDEIENPFWRAVGSWIPLPRPVVPPITELSDEPLLKLSFNEEWRPLVVSALSVLARPETYDEGLTGFIEEDARRGAQFPWQITPDVLDNFYNWRLIQKPGDNGDSAIVVDQLLIAPGHDGSYGSQVVVFNGCANCEDSHQVTLVGQQGGSPFTVGVGGHVASIFAFTLESIIGNAWSVSITDCLDNTVVHTGGGSTISISGQDLKEIQVVTLGAFIVSIIIDEDYSCSPA